MGCDGCSRNDIQIMNITGEEDDERAKDKLTLMLRDLLGEVKVEINEMAK